MDFQAEKRQVLDPRVAFVMTDMLSGVLNFGTAFEVRGRYGFNAPAAGKTGTSHDGWFAGYTSNLLCIVWVGYDDYSDIRLSGAQTALPIWVEFMKKATALPQYSNVKPFTQPSGVVDVQLDKTTNLLATSACPQTYTAAFIAGTEPNTTCDEGGVHGFFSKIFGLGNDKALPPPPLGSSTAAAADPNSADSDPAKKKKGLLGKITGIFKNDKAVDPPPKPPMGNEAGPH
jgi:penicillin-binding protein 1B